MSPAPREARPLPSSVPHNSSKPHNPPLSPQVNDGAYRLATSLLSWGDHCRTLLGADRCQILQYREEEEKLIGYIDGSGQRLEFSLNDPSCSGVLTWCAHFKQTINLPEARKDMRFNPEVDSASGYETHSVLVVPMRSGCSGELLGVCQVVNKMADGQIVPFGLEDEVALAAALCLCALRMENNLQKSYCDQAEARNMAN